ncbi:hypothetical protein [Pseudomonas sp.]|uniref:hypothetical protein n=1 Tax=Pseudomonas sp. TaxID=306 RepID=UPI003F37830D
MALISCHECKKEISSEAKVCPNCGAEPRQKFKIGRTILLIMVVIVIGKCATMPDKSEKQAAMSPEERAAQQKAEEDSQRRHIAAASGMLAIKKSLRDPGSVIWETVLVNDDASTVCIEYRAKNGFGGYSKEHAAFFGNRSSQTATDWNKQCANKTMHDQKHSALAIK